MKKEKRTINWLIATTMKPETEDGFREVMKAVDSTSPNVDLKGAIWCEGPGCSNLGLRLEGSEEEQEKVVHNTTIAMMPAKYSNSSDEIEEKFICKLDNLETEFSELKGE